MPGHRRTLIAIDKRRLPHHSPPIDRVKLLGLTPIVSHIVTFRIRGSRDSEDMAGQEVLRQSQFGKQRIGLSVPAD